MTTRLTTEPGFRRIAEIVLAASKAEHTLVELDHTLATTLRFANNQAVQHVSQQSPGLSVTVSFGKREGTASTNRLDEASLREVVRAAESIAKVAPEDPEHLSPLGPQSYAPLPSTRPATAAATPMDLAQRAKALIDGCVARRLTAAGTVSTTLETIAQKELDQQPLALAGDAAALVDHVVETHHEYLRRELPRLHELMGKVVAAHGAVHPELVDVAQTLEAIEEDLLPHLDKEEHVLFPLAKELDADDAAVDPAAEPVGA